MDAKEMVFVYFFTGEYDGYHYGTLTNICLNTFGITFHYDELVLIK